MNDSATSGVMRCGMAAIVGRPNVGKSTLLNALIGERLSITSHHPQTTRHRILGVLTRDDLQIAFVDTPGYQTRHTGAMPKMMNRTVTQAITGVDVAVLVVEALKFNEGDAQVLALIPKDVPLILAVNKVDTVAEKGELLPFIEMLSQKRDFAAVVPVSAEKRVQIEPLIESIGKLLPQSDGPLFDVDTLTDRSERFLAAERVREKLFRLTGDEIPFSTTVVIEQWKDLPGRKEIAAAILVARESHKKIVIGNKGERIKRIGTEARQDLQTLFDCKVHLELWVKVREGWAQSEASLKALGYE
jgi:GTP-binding protein Era